MAKESYTRMFFTRFIVILVFFLFLVLQIALCKKGFFGWLLSSLTPLTGAWLTGLERLVIILVLAANFRAFQRLFFKSGQQSFENSAENAKL